jgi:hypothetical protein
VQNLAHHVKSDEHLGIVVGPDIEVEQVPEAVRHLRDLDLECLIEEAMARRTR